MPAMVTICKECGLEYYRGCGPDERYHRARHDKAVNGPRTALGDGFHFVTHRSGKRLQLLARAAAYAARRDTHYDFASFTGMEEREDPFQTVAALYVANARVCALVVSRVMECEYTADLASFQLDSYGGWRPGKASRVEMQRRRTFEMIWVLRKRRRQGIANRLVHALAEHCGCQVEDFAHTLPFCEDAVRFWTAFGSAELYIA